MAQLAKLWNIRIALNLKPSAEKYLLSGRVANFRPYKSFNFVDLVDGSTKDHIQVVVNKDLLPKPELGSYITCGGSLVSSRGDKQAIEFKADTIHFSSKCNPDIYPLASRPKVLPRRWTHLKPHLPDFASLLRLRCDLENAIHTSLRNMDFILVRTPNLTANDSEASSDLFLVKRTKIQQEYPSSNDSEQKEEGEESESDEDDTLQENPDDGVGPGDARGASTQPTRLVRDDYFNKDVFLGTSAQLHLESLAAALSRVYTISTTFRAENSVTKRHLCEFSMLEVEEADVSIHHLMDRVELITKFIARSLSETSNYRADLEHLLAVNSNAEVFGKLLSSPYIRMHYSEAMRIISEKTDYSGNTAYGADIGRVQEKLLLNYCDNVPIFITNFPKQLKPFYMKCDADDKEAECFDLIAPHGGELCGGSLREDNYEKLLANLRLHQPQLAQLDSNSKESEHLEWYLDTRRFGSFPHGGFGIGIERMLQSLLGIKNIRNTTAFPRWSGHCPM